MRNILPLLLFALLPAVRLGAQTPLTAPLSFVPADSVLFWSQDFSNPCLVAMFADSTVRATDVTLKPCPAQEVEARLEKWKQNVAGFVNLTGACYAEGETAVNRSSVAMFYSSAEFLLRTGHARCAEIIERTIWNALPAEVLHGNEPARRRVAAKMLMDAAGMVFATDSAGVYVNYYTGCFTRIRRGNLHLTLDVQTTLPNNPQVKIRISGLRPGQNHFKLRLYMPPWATDSLLGGDYRSLGAPAAAPIEVYLNGRSERFPLVNGYLEIDRAWRNGEEIYFNLPFEPHYVAQKGVAPAEAKAVAIRLGPMLYVAKSPSDAAVLTAHPLTPDHSQRHSATVAVLASQLSGTDTIPLIAVPYAESRGQVWLRRGE